MSITRRGRAAHPEAAQDCLDKDISLEELQLTVKRLKQGKASGVDEILAEWLKHGGERMTYALWILVNHVWKSEDCPSTWGKGAIKLRLTLGRKNNVRKNKKA